ncbi:MAG: glycosyltransferase family 39 protein [Candidatus Omnitrophica bacterium]|nr:glycosyltransferase family 39 protein [Candidatus Omnitrophota bacterium]
MMKPVPDHLKGELWTRRILFGIVLVLAFGLRIFGVQFGLPYIYHADEPVVVNHALAYGTGDLHPHFFKIPPLVSYLLFLAYGIFFLTGRVFGIFQRISDFEYFFYADPSAFYLIARFLFGVAAGTASVAVLYHLIRKHFDPDRALLSAFFMAIAFLHVKDSHYAYVDIPLVFVLILAFFPILKMIGGDDRVRSHLLTGILTGLAIGTKYNGMVVVVPYFYASVMARERGRILKGWMAFLGGFVPVLVATNPYAFLDFAFFLKELTIQSKAQCGVGWIQHLRYSLAGGLGLPLLACALVGLGRQFFAPHPKAGCLAVFIVFYYMILSLWGQPYDRYALPLIPFLLFMAADLIVGLSQPLRGLRIPFLVLSAAVVSAPSIISCLLFGKIMLEKDVRTVAKDWVVQNIPSGTRLALDWDFYVPRLKFSRAQLEEKQQEVLSLQNFSRAQLRRLDYLLNHDQSAEPAYELYFLLDDPIASPRFLFAKPGVPYDVSFLQFRGIEYVIIVRLHDRLERSDFFRDLIDHSELVARFSPYRDLSRQGSYDSVPLTGGPFLLGDLLLRTRNGQMIEIYRLKPAPNR